jgi:phosphopantothenoylcysteine synthetase/decarboxylase
MWDHPATARHLTQIAGDLRGVLHVIEPIEKRLACDDVGLGAMASRDQILATIAKVTP